jgi:hypothetical protein
MSWFLSQSAACLNPTAARRDRSASKREADSRRATFATGKAAAASAISSSRSTKNRRALAPVGNGAESRSAANETPALQPGFEGPAGSRAACSPRYVTRPHQPDSEIDREVLLGRRPLQCVAVPDEPQHQSVRGVRDVDGRGRFLVLDPDAAARAHRHALHRVRRGRETGLEVRVAPGERVPFVANREKPLVVGIGRVGRRAFALSNDRIEGCERRLDADDRLCAGEIDLGRRELKRGVAAECIGFAETIDQVAQPVTERLVERAHRVVVETHRHQSRPGETPSERELGREARAVRLVGSRRPLQVDEVLEHVPIERRQSHDDARGQAARIEREVVAPETR